jgi:uncharacterized protein (TIGR02145 family)
MIIRNQSAVLLFAGLLTVTSYAQEKMKIDGAFIIGNSEDASPTPGTIRFNPATSDFEGWNGLYWASLTGKLFTAVGGSVSDIDGNTYATVQIGTQEWMAVNLRTTRYRNGDPIPLISLNSQWINTNSGAYCIYDTSGTGYNTFDVSTFGFLYNWFAVNDERGLCPSGWHVPSQTEWTTLTDFLGGPLVAGGKMKESGLIHWHSPNTGATNESGFTAVPGGLRESDFGEGDFNAIGRESRWWSSTYIHDTYTRSFGLSTFHAEFPSTTEYLRAGHSVRCVKD